MLLDVDLANAMLELPERNVHRFVRFDIVA